MTTTLPLSALRFGHEGAVNARKAGRDDAIDVLAKSIRHYLAKGGSGLILPLAVAGPGDARNGAPVYDVIDGNRRLAALRQLAREGAIRPDHAVPVLVHGRDTALSMSLAANITPLPLHPVDRYETFAALAETMSEAEIGACFGLKPKEVKQTLALGKLSARVRDAWRDGRIDAEAAQVFTLAEPKRQDQVLARLLKERHGTSRVGAWEVRREIAGDQNAARELLPFVGEEAYQAAGGMIVKDLFGRTGDLVSDVALLRQLAEQKLNAACERLVAEGWSWALPEHGLDFERWQARRIDAEPVFTKEESREKKALEKELAAIRRGDHDDDDTDALEIDDREEEIEDKLAALKEAARCRAYTPEQKAKSGCIVSIDAIGRLRIEAGILKPGERKPREEAKAKAKKKEKEKEKEKDGPAISNALMQRLSWQLTAALSDCLRQDPSVSLAAIAAGFAARGQPIEVKAEGLAYHRSLREGGVAVVGRAAGFADVFNHLLAGGQKAQAAALAEIAARACNCQAMHASHPPLDEHVAALAAALKPAAVRKALAKAFDAKDYFGSVSKQLCLAAIREALNADEARKAQARPKADLVKFCVANVPRTGWLPPELRTVHYDGPGAKRAGAAKPSRRQGAPATRKSGGRKRSRSGSRR